MDLIEILHFNPEEFKILKSEIKALNISYNESASKNYGQNLSLALWNVD
jgi:hypothetical protein